MRIRDARLVRQAEFDQVFAENQRARTDSLIVMARRNRVKRCIREGFRLNLDELPACDFVVRLTEKPTPGEEARDLGRTLKRAGQRAMEKWPAAESLVPTT